MQTKEKLNGRVSIRIIKVMTVRLGIIVLEENEWIPVEFRGVCPPRIAPEICFAYKESLWVLDSGANAFQIIMSINLFGIFIIFL